MCAILDRNKFGDFREPTEEGRLFREWVEEGGGRIIYLVNDRPTRLPTEIAEDMQRLSKEYDKNPNVERLLNQYRLSGRTRRVKLSEVAKWHPETAAAKSNDRHILAMALASGARLLYTKDKRLARDFRDAAIINNPRGVVYSRISDSGNLRSDVCVPPPVDGVNF